MNEEEYPRVLSPHFTIPIAKVNSVEIPSVGQMKNVPCPPTQDTWMSTCDEQSLEASLTIEFKNRFVPRMWIAFFSRIILGIMIQ